MDFATTDKASSEYTDAVAEVEAATTFLAKAEARIRIFDAGGLFVEEESWVMRVRLVLLQTNWWLRRFSRATKM